LDAYVENVTHNSANLKCELACFSPGLECALVNLSSNTIRSLAINGTNDVIGSNASYNYPTQQITLTNLISETTYEYCILAINMTNMTKIGSTVCKNFTALVIIAGKHLYTVN